MVWKSAIHPNIVLSDFKACGWKENGELLWMDEPFPEDIEQIMFDSRYQDQCDKAVKTRVTTNWTSLMHSAKVNVKES